MTEGDDRLPLEPSLIGDAQDEGSLVPPREEPARRRDSDLEPGELDEALEESFPASDPLPGTSHA